MGADVELCPAPETPVRGSTFGAALGRLLTPASGSDRSIRSAGPHIEIGARVRQIRRSSRPCEVGRQGSTTRPASRRAISTAQQNHQSSVQVPAGDRLRGSELTGKPNC
jgi:hypothetical protein